MIRASWARTQACRAQTEAFPPHNLGLHYRRRRRTPQAPLSGFGGGGRLGLRRGHHDPTCHLPCHCKKYSRAREGAQLANAKPDDLSPIPGSHMVERETLESCPLAAACMCPYTYTHVTHQYVPMHIQPHTNKLRCKTIAIIRHGRTWKEGRRGRTVRLLFQKDLGAERSLLLCLECQPCLLRHSTFTPALPGHQATGQDGKWVSGTIPFGSHTW